MRSCNGFTRRLELEVRDPGLPCLIDALLCCLAILLIAYVAGPAAWWPAIVGLLVSALLWRRRLVDLRQRGPARLIVSPDERWLIQSRDSLPRPAKLSGAWLVGPVCGLLFETEDGCRWRVYLTAGPVSRDTWRRFMVRLRLPRHPA
jgi:hypothetical protein